QIALVEAYAREQGLWHDERSEQPTFTNQMDLDLEAVEPSLAGPKRPQDRVPLSDAQGAFRSALENYTSASGDAKLGNAHDEAVAESYPASDPPADGAPGHAPPPAPSPPQLPRTDAATATAP